MRERVLRIVLWLYGLALVGSFSMLALDARGFFVLARVTVKAFTVSIISQTGVLILIIVIDFIKKGSRQPDITREAIERCQDDRSDRSATTIAQQSP